MSTHPAAATMEAAAEVAMVKVNYRNRSEAAVDDHSLKVS
jgi:hypothetical protein